MTPFVWKLTLEYDGTDFSGWQWQPGLRTVQSETERGLGILLRRPTRIAGAGRTDAGVHAAGQVATFPAVESDLSVDGLPFDHPDRLYRLNAILEADVAVVAAARMPPRFHARFSAVRRRYAYTMHRGKSPLAHRRALELRGPIDVDRLRDAAARLPGHRDFASLGSPTDPGEPTVCRLERVDVLDRGDHLILEVSANRFLRKMVRTLVGALLEVARGKRPPEWIDELLEGKDRRLAPAPVAARGLTLLGVDYSDHPPEG